MAKKSITAFQSELNGIGFARSNIFEVTLNAPVTLSDKTVPAKTKFLIKAASLPASNIGTIAIPYNGRVFNVPGDRTFDAWSTTIMNTENFETRKFIERWIKDIQDLEVNFTKTDNLDYTTNLSVTAFDRDSKGSEKLKTSRKYTFHHAFPSSMSAIDLDFASNDAVEEFTCEWQYSHWSVN